MPLPSLPALATFDLCKTNQQDGSEEEFPLLDNLSL